MSLMRDFHSKNSSVYIYLFIFGGNVYEKVCWVLLHWLVAEGASPRCGSGDPCIYVNKDVGWIGREDTEYSEHHPPPVQLDPGSVNTTTIFVAISSFRDKLCPVTLVNLFTKALNPDRLTVAVVQQNVPGDIDCLEEYCKMMYLRSNPNTDEESIPSLDQLLDSCPYKSNVLMKRLDGLTARGPTWARSYGSQMIGDQEFCLQIDSHMDFAYHWDSSMVDMWAATENEYAVLSTYVTDTSDYDSIKDKSKGINGLQEVPYLCIVRFHGSGGMPRNFGTKCLRSFPRPKLTMTWGAGLSFSKCHAERKVPYDPFTPGIFDGEEWSRAARYWTWGYDIYTPHRIYISHNYKKSQSDPNHMKWHGNSPGQFNVMDSMDRIEYLLHMKANENVTKGELVRRSKYGLGDRRTFDQFKEYSGVDPLRRKTTKDKCGNLKYVPFVEHPKGPNYIPEFHPDTFVSLEVPDEGSIYYKEYIDALDARKNREVNEAVERKSVEDKTSEDNPVGDLDLSSLIDDKGNENNQAETGDGGKASVKTVHNINKKNLFIRDHADVPITYGNDIHMYKSIAIDLAGFSVICLICYYMLCVPSRSLKTQ